MTTQTQKTCYTPCPIERGIALIGGKWKASILWHLKDEPVRFNELCRQISGASKRMVTQRLTEMEDNGLVVREVISTRPIAVQYAITELGRSSLVVLEQLRDWVESYEVKVAATQSALNE